MAAGLSILFGGMGAGLAAIGLVDSLSLRSPRELTIFQQKGLWRNERRHLLLSKNPARWENRLPQDKREVVQAGGRLPRWGNRAGLRNSGMA